MTAIVRVLLAASLFAVLASPASAQTPSPTAQTQAAAARLVADTTALTDSQAPAATRAKLLKDATRAQALLLSKPCRAIEYIERYREALRGVDQTTPTTANGAPGPPSARGRLDRSALAVDAGLRQFRSTRSCGGGAAASHTASLDSNLGQSTKHVMKLHVKLPRARWDALSGGGADFIGLNMDGADATGGVGDPGVPAFTRLFAVPRGAHVSVKVSNARSYTLSDIDVMPKQEQAVDQLPPEELPPETFADKPFEIDKGAYRGHQMVPRRLAYVTKLGELRDMTVAGVQVPGAQYDPRERALQVFTSMDITVTFKGGHRWLPDRVRTSFEAPFEQIYGTALENYRTVKRSHDARKAADTDEDAQEFVPACGEDYLIVTSSTLRPAADTLAAVKQTAGYVVGIHEVAPGTPATDVRTFIRGEMNNDNCVRPTYVLLLGDTSHVPTFLEQWCSDPATCTVSSDLSYSLDGIGTDAFADVMLGRIPAPTLDIAQQTVDKIITYETQLPAPPGDDFYNHATVTSNFDGLGPRDGRGFTLSAERMRAGLLSRGHVVTRLNSAQAGADIQLFKDGTPFPDELKRPATPWTDGRDQVISELNAGRFLFVHRDHGSRFGWANPTFTINDIPSLNSNSTELPVIFAINCSSGSFQFPGSPSLAERLLQRQGGGGVAIIADTDVSPTVQNDQLTVGWADAMFPATVPTFGSSQPLTRMGEILNAGKAYMAAQAGPSQQLTGNVYREELIWHLLGDPSMEIRAAVPTAFDTTKVTTKFVHRTGTFPVGDPSFQVRVNSTQPGTDGTIATVKHAGEVIGRGTISGGTTTITPTKRTDSASLSVSLERDGFLPAELPVSAPVPVLTMTCPSSVNVPQEDNIQVGGTLSPRVSGATIRLRVTRANGVVTTQTTTTDANSTWRVKLTPITTAHLGNATVEAFFDGAGKYGADQAICTVPIV
jgi:hypothetical protein